MTATSLVIRPDGDGWKLMVGKQKVLERSSTQQELVERADMELWEQNRPGVIFVLTTNELRFSENARYWAARSWTNEHKAPVVMEYDGADWVLYQGGYKKLSMEPNKDAAYNGARNWYQNLGLSGLVVETRDGDYQEFEPNYDYWEKYV